MTSPFDLTFPYDFTLLSLPSPTTFSHLTQQLTAVASPSLLSVQPLGVPGHTQICPCFLYACLQHSTGLWRGSVKSLLLGLFSSTPQQFNHFSLSP